MTKFLLRDVIGFGFLLWLFGYLLGFAFFAFVPQALLGWYIMPIGIAATYLVLWKFIRFQTLHHAILLGVLWAIIAIVCDYLFLVKLLNPADGYYKPDVYIYYALTFIIPVTAYFMQRNQNS